MEKADQKFSSQSRWVENNAHSLAGSASNWQTIIQEIGERKIVLIGESSHGTHEFYQHRCELSKELIQKHGFAAVLIEGDWPDAFRVNQYVRGDQEIADAESSLNGFQRFPQWMWRNPPMLDFVSWLRDYNSRIESPKNQTGFYGLDLYSLYSSIDEVVGYLQSKGKSAALQARDRYGCFSSFQDSQQYGRSVAYGASNSCRRAAAAQLEDLRRGRSYYIKDDSFFQLEAFLSAEINAQTILDAEEYYRSMFSHPEESWNLREQHMANTVDRVLAHLEYSKPESGIIIWAHNSHVGDSRATSMGQRGEKTLGRYMRERYGSQAYLIGQTTYSGTVTAASDWEMPPRHQAIRPALEGSLEDLFYHSAEDDFLLINHPGQRYLKEPLLHRAIGVVYRPQTERQSHYLYGSAAMQFDAIIHTHHTRALEPLEHDGSWTPEPPATYPSAV